MGSFSKEYLDNNFKQINKYWADKKIEVYELTKDLMFRRVTNMASWYLSTFQLPIVRANRKRLLYAILFEKDESLENDFAKSENDFLAATKNSLSLFIFNWSKNSFLLGLDANRRGIQSMRNMYDLEKPAGFIQDDEINEMMKYCSWQILLSFRDISYDYSSNNEKLEQLNDFKQFIESEIGKFFVASIDNFLGSIYGLGLMAYEVYTNRIPLKNIHQQL